MAGSDRIFVLLNTISGNASTSKKSTTKHKKKVKKSASHTDSVKVKAAQ